ncbi:hypothetical protein ABF179_002102 [Flavobacterium psychrophilum]|uniref:Uncharacterized protein n=1 Tax=Flavobacterium psychrophilum TaxID=96345 RepID=A0A7U2NDS8_FLAPS|nr:hypothetical protein [Flavobacterium psychrophilum]EKT3957888.1 hypothetical protein [Flavobacterium psychrophilum]EKT4510108.1 hypothetical protein [Flavobacterium psychrophilum]EKT4552980.1 hypothetical protein [Flavobacterium psychrophilum]ELI6454783.1 hypothetical protein [Flavobacterium psychrophilum]ELV7525920.1 hypothetical protein [Flavobacterium psychrophilum]
MEKIGHIEIRITGSKGNIELSPDNYDIREIIAILENAENLLYPGDKKERPIISYNIEQGSVKHILKTSIQFIIGFNAIIGQVSNIQEIDFLDLQTAKAFENLQNIAIKKDYIFSIKTSLENSNEVKVDRTTRYIRTEAIWADAEFYFYGKITNAGGKDKANIHILTADFGTIRIQTPISFLEDYEENLLYKSLGIRALGKQHSSTGEIDTTTLKFLELVDYQPKYDDLYLKGLREKAKKSWLDGIDPDSWLKEIRGGYDA